MTAHRPVRHLAAFCASFAVTLGAGLAVQERDALAERLGMGPRALALTAPGLAPLALPPEAVAAVAPGARLVTISPDLATPGALPAAAPPRRAPAAPAMAGLGPLEDVVPVAFEAGQFALPAPAWGPACGVTIAAAPAPLASLDLTVTAPCAAGGPVTIRHEGLAATALADAEGRLALRLPVLASPAVVVVETAAGERAQAQAEVAGLERLTRIVLQGRGEADLGLHLREGGAAYGEPGHVHAGAPGSAEAALAGTGGMLLRLGEAAGPAPLWAEIYTAPRDLPVEVSAEAGVSGQRCGRTVAAEMLAPGVAPLALTLDLPDCASLVGTEWAVLPDLGALLAQR